LAACKSQSDVKPAPSASAVATSAFGCDGMPDDEAALYKKASDLVEPYMTLQNRPRNDANDREKSLRGGIACVDRVITINPKNWQAFWVRGKAWQGLGDHAKAQGDFQAAYTIRPDELDVGRELGLELLDLEKFDDSKNIWQELIKKWPDNAGLHANLAIALVILGDTPGAQREIATARTLDPSDPVTKQLDLRIKDVASGQRRKPENLKDLVNRTTVAKE
jgi:tetratricopeptide (TPR) repeat protein